MHLYRGNCKRWAKVGAGGRGYDPLLQNCTCWREASSRHHQGRYAVRGYDPLLQSFVPVGGKLLPDITKGDTLFGDMIPSYKTVPVGGKLLPDIAEADTLLGDMIASYKALYL